MSSVSATSAPAAGTRKSASAAAGVSDLGVVSAERDELRASRLRKLDPMRAHGAWVLLFTSVGAGALLGAEQAGQRAMLVGTFVVGGYLLASAIFVGIRRRRRQAAIGTTLALLAPTGALWLDPSPAFLIVASIASVLAIIALGIARWRGFLSQVTIVAGTAALASAAPVTAIGGGATLAQAAALYALLWPCFCWRTLRVAATLEASGRWNGQELRSRGLREAALAAAWGLLASFVARFI